MPSSFVTAMCSNPRSESRAVILAPVTTEPFASVTLPFSVEFEMSAWPKAEERKLERKRGTRDAKIKSDRETVVILGIFRRKNMRKKHLIMLAVGRFCEVSVRPPKGQSRITN